jgi:hypothetical protein
MMIRHNAGDLAYRLGRNAEAVCRRYLDAGRKQGNYWLVGDAHNTPGRSLFVRLSDSPKGPAGKWQDAATGKHGDLLDIIRLALGLAAFTDAAKEARAFLSLPHPKPVRLKNKLPRAASGSLEAARRLFAMSQPLGGSLAETYLRQRGIAVPPGPASLRFHPRCYYRSDCDEVTQTWPAMIAAVTDLDGQITGVHRTWLAPGGTDKAPVDPAQGNGTPARPCGWLWRARRDHGSR